MDQTKDKPWRPPRVCADYRSEYKHCKSFLNRFRHYYAYGTLQSCSQWMEDYNNCVEWEARKDIKAKEALQRSERSRVAQQDKTNPVWQLRQEPPKDWNMPLKQEKPEDSTSIF